MQTQLLKEINTVLKEFPQYWENGTLKRYEVIDAIENKEENIIKALINNEKVRDEYGHTVDGVLLFDFSKLISLIQYKEYWKNSFTKYKNKIGLATEGKYLDYDAEVVLDFPFKDCVLEGGMSKEENGKNEVYYNEIIASDEIDRLFAPKVLTNAKRITKDSETLITDLNRNEDGIITDNLVIKGNNLLALHTLKEQFAGKIKLIYIDPPYNPSGKNNTFAYNNNFKHSTWLVFMKNRLEIAKKLLTSDGAMIIAIDDNEFKYLGILIDEVFSGYESHCVTIVHNPRGIQGTNFSYTNEYAYFVFPKGMKIIGNRKIEEEDIDFRGLRDNGGESLREDARNCFYPILVDIQTMQVIDFGEVCEDGFHPTANIIKDDFAWVYPIDGEGIERKWRYARQSIEEVKDLLKVVRNRQGNYDIQLGKNFGQYRTVWQDKRYDANEYGTKLINSLVPNNTFSFPKSLWNVYDALYAVVRDDKEAIILDYHAGSGTTAHAVLELNKDGGNRKFIMVEQMDYIETITSARIKAVIQRENLDDNFVYFELAKLNQNYVDKIKNTENSDQLLSILDTMKAEAYLNYQIELDDILNKTYEISGIDHEVSFADLDINEQKESVIGLLDKNQLYINLSEINDKNMQVSENDKLFTDSFYKKGDN